MKPAFLFDGRNMLDHAALVEIGFEVHALGKGQIGRGASQSPDFVMRAGSGLLSGGGSGATTGDGTSQASVKRSGRGMDGMAVCREYLLANYERARHRLQERMHSLLVQLRSLSPERASSPAVKRRAMKLPTAWSEVKMRHCAAAKSAEKEKEVKSLAPKLVEVMRSCQVGDQASKDQVEKLQREVQSLRAAEAAAAQKVQELQQLLDEGTLDKLRQLQSLEQEVPGLKKRLEELQAASEQSEKLREEVQSLREAVAKPDPLDEVLGLRQTVQELQATADQSERLQEEVQSLRTAEAAAAQKVQELQQLLAEAERPASTDEGALEKLQQLHCLEEEVGVVMNRMNDVLANEYSLQFSKFL
eukprot:s2031_g5.t1